MSAMTSIDRHAQALSLLAHRQKVLAGNIANADTPGFHARDFDFSSALSAARGEGGGLRASHAGHLGAGGTRPGESVVSTVDLQWRRPDQAALDGNSVDLDQERAAFADNALRYEATLRFITSDVRTLLSAITGQ